IDIFETASPTALGEEALDSSDFELCLGEADEEAEETLVRQSQQTQLAVDDAAREAALYELPVAAARREVAGAALQMVAPQRLGERQATIRYYHRMSPERMFPLRVIISRKAILEVIKRDVAQRQSKKFQVALDSLVEVEPILPGCDCFPPKENIRIGQAESTATFWVVPRVLGEVMHARVVVRQNGAVLAEVPLEM